MDDVISTMTDASAPDASAPDSRSAVRNASIHDIPGNITSVGAFVTREEAVLVVKLKYGPTRGQYSLPGGWLDVGEEVDTAAAREVREETQIEARGVGLIGLRTRTEAGRSITDLIWLLAHVSGTPNPDPDEADEARYLSFDEVDQRDDVEDIVTELVGRLRAGRLHPQCLVGRNVDDAPGAPPEAWKLYV